MGLATLFLFGILRLVRDYEFNEHTGLYDKIANFDVTSIAFDKAKMDVQIQVEDGMNGGDEQRATGAVNIKVVGEGGTPCCSKYC